MKTLMTAIFFSLLTSTAFAGLSGNYRVIKGECNGLLNSATQAVVMATASKVQVAVIFKNPGGNPFTRAALNYSVGTVRRGCMGMCYYLDTGSYSSDGNQFTVVSQFARFADSTPVYSGEVNITLNGEYLEIQDGEKECVLKKVTL
jgi:hypothetical protein